MEKKAKQVSFNQETAKHTEAHNDRSMYKHGYGDRSKNVHWDMYDCGSSVEAEKRFYEETFSDVVEAQNAKAVEMRKYERVMSVEDYHLKHMPKECIIQLGQVGNSDTSREFAERAFLLAKKKIEAAGGKVISADIHDDERTINEATGEEIIGTSHLHIRYVFLHPDKQGRRKIDMKNCLLAHGFERPDTTKKDNRNNNPAQMFLDDMRTALEDLADEIELKHGNPKVNRNHSKRKHSAVAKYKAAKQVENLRKEAERLATANDAVQENIEKQEQVIEKNKQTIGRQEMKIKAKKDELASLDNQLSVGKDELKLIQAREEAVKDREANFEAEKKEFDKQADKINSWYAYAEKFANEIRNLLREMKAWYALEKQQGPLPVYKEEQLQKDFETLGRVEQYIEEDRKEMEQDGIYKPIVFEDPDPDEENEDDWGLGF